MEMNDTSRAREFVRERFAKFYKRCQLFIRTHDETLFVVEIAPQQKALRFYTGAALITVSIRNG
jgi:hypothetical protein